MTGQGLLMSMIRYLVLVGLLLQAGQILAETIVGRVVGVHDGDTITVLDSTKIQHKVRLAGIDAPGTCTSLEMEACR